MRLLAIDKSKFPTAEIDELCRNLPLLKLVDADQFNESLPDDFYDKIRQGDRQLWVPQEFLEL